MPNNEAPAEGQKLREITEESTSNDAACYACLYCGSTDHSVDLEGMARIIVCRGCETRVPIAVMEDAPQRSAERLVRLLAIAIIEADAPECRTPARCMMRHGPRCRVTRWEKITAAVKNELESLHNAEAQTPATGASADTHINH